MGYKVAVLAVLLAIVAGSAHAGVCEQRAQICSMLPKQWMQTSCIDANKWASRSSTLRGVGPGGPGDSFPSACGLTSKPGTPSTTAILAFDGLHIFYDGPGDDTGDLPAASAFQYVVDIVPAGPQDAVPSPWSHQVSMSALYSPAGQGTQLSVTGTVGAPETATIRGMWGNPGNTDSYQFSPTTKGPVNLDACFQLQQAPSACYLFWYQASTRSSGVSVGTIQLQASPIASLLKPTSMRQFVNTGLDYPSFSWRDVPTAFTCTFGAQPSALSTRP